MSDNIITNESIKELVDDIIIKCNIEPPLQIDYYPGSEVGDGYASRTTAVHIKSGNKSLDLFLKYALNVKSTEMMPLDKLYINETHFYNIICPAYKKFVEERNIQDIFTNIPKCYGTSKENIIALENLRKRNFVLYEKTQFMNDEHVTCVLKAFAKFHAISFAFKEQEPKKYQTLIPEPFDFTKAFAFEKMITSSISEFLDRLDPDKDKHILELSTHIKDVLTKIALGVNNTVNEYSIITQGDCWVNNMMFQYEGDNKKIPKDMMLIDWQLIRPASPVFDVSYFFFTIASKENLENVTNYLKVYHEELSKQIRNLGSDPNILYPYHVFENEWKQFCTYGFALAFILLKAMLYKRDEVPNFEDMDMEDMKENPELIFPIMENNEEYINRLRTLTEYFIEQGLL